MTYSNLDGIQIPAEGDAGLAAWAAQVNDNSTALWGALAQSWQPWLNASPASISVYGDSIQEGYYHHLGYTVTAMYAVQLDGATTTTGLCGIVLPVPYAVGKRVIGTCVIKDASTGKRYGGYVVAYETGPGTGVTLHYSGYPNEVTSTAPITLADGDVIEVHVFYESDQLSEGLTASEEAPAGPPYAPPAPSATEGDTTLDVVWSAPYDNGSAITSYEARMSVLAAETWDTFTGLPTTPTSQQFPSLTNGVTYEVQIRAVNAEGTGNWSPSGTGTPAAAGVVTLTVTSPNTPTVPATNRLSYTNAPGNDNVTDVLIRRPPDPDVHVTELDVPNYFDFLNQTGEKTYEVKITGDLGQIASGEVVWTSGSAGSASSSGGVPPGGGGGGGGGLPSGAAGQYFTGTYGDTYTQTLADSAGYTPVLETGDGTTEVRTDVGTFTAVDGGISFTPVKFLQSEADHTIDYTVNGGSVATATFTFDPFYWDGPIAYSIPTSTTTVAPSGLQAAINAASTDDVIEVSDGTYSGAQITLNKRLTICASTKHGAQFTFTSASDAGGFHCAAGSSGSTIIGIEILNAPAGKHGFYVGGAALTGITLEHVKVTNSTGTNNYYFTGCSNLTLESCEGWAGDYSTTGVDIGVNGDPNIKIYNGSNILVQNCKFSGGDYRCMFLDHVYGATIEKCWVEKSRRQGCYNIACTDINYINNRVVDVGEAGIQFNEVFVTAGGGCDIAYNTVWATDITRTDRMIDPISVYKSGGRADNKLLYRRNRTWHVGYSVVGSGGMTGDAGGGHQEVTDNVVVDAGQTGMGIYGGANIAHRRNRIFGDGASTWRGAGSSAGLGAVGLYCWIGPSHADTVGGIYYGRGSHVHEANEVYFRWPNSTFNNVWIENAGDITGQGSNILGSASETLGMSTDMINQW